MANQNKTGYYMRLVHRYLGFFLAGIMAMYAISGTVLVFRSTDYLKKETIVSTQVASNLPAEEIGKALKIKRLEIDKVENGIYHFDGGSYNSITGATNYTKKELPYVLGKMTKLHKANTNSPLYFLNLFFGLALLFFVISSFWMFMPHTKVFKKGLYFTLGGIVLTLILLFV